MSQLQPRKQTIRQLINVQLIEIQSGRHKLGRDETHCCDLTEQQSHFYGCRALRDTRSFDAAFYLLARLAGGKLVQHQYSLTATSVGLINT